MRGTAKNRQNKEKIQQFWDSFTWLQCVSGWPQHGLPLVTDQRCKSRPGTSQPLVILISEIRFLYFCHLSHIWLLSNHKYLGRKKSNAYQSQNIIYAYLLKWNSVVASMTINHRKCPNIYFQRHQNFPTSCVYFLPIGHFNFSSFTANSQNAKTHSDNSEALLVGFGVDLWMRTPPGYKSSERESTHIWPFEHVRLPPARGGGDPRGGALGQEGHAPPGGGELSSAWPEEGLTEEKHCSRLRKGPSKVQLRNGLGALNTCGSPNCKSTGKKISSRTKQFTSLHHMYEGAYVAWM